LYIESESAHSIRQVGESEFESSCVRHQRSRCVRQVAEPKFEMKKNLTPIPKDLKVYLYLIS